VKVTRAWRAPEPDASAKRPVPPVIVKVPEDWKTPATEVGQIVRVAEDRT
jgi:hypothetical protein